MTRSGTMRMLFPGRASAVREVGALSNLNNISVGIADVAARLAVFGDWLRDELRSSTFSIIHSTLEYPQRGN